MRAALHVPERDIFLCRVRYQPDQGARAELLFLFLVTSAVQTRDRHRRIGVCPVGMDTFTHAQYGWRCGLPWRSHFRRVAKAGDEDVRSMTLHRAGLAFRFDAAPQKYR
jgi:hypothetical protein